MSQNENKERLKITSIWYANFIVSRSKHNFRLISFIVRFETYKT